MIKITLSPKYIKTQSVKQLKMGQCKKTILIYKINSKALWLKSFINKITFHVKALKDYLLFIII